MDRCPVCNEFFDGKSCNNCGFEDTYTDAIKQLTERYGADAEMVQGAKKMLPKISIRSHRKKWLETFREFEFSVGTLALEKYKGPSSTVVIPYGVDRIWSYDGAFSNNLVITKICLPDTVTSIGFKSFAGCKNLETIEIPDGVTKIEHSTFQNCNSLNLSIPRNVSEIDEGAITCVRHINVHANNPYFRVHQGMLIDLQRGILLAAAFEKNDMDVVVPEEVKRIGSMAFSIERNFPRSITLPQGLETIGSWALSSFTKVPVVIPKTVKEIENYALTLGNAILEEGNPNYITRNNMIIDSRTNKLISICNKEAASIIIPSGVKAIADGAFWNCKKLTEVTIPKSVEEIGNYAFCGCKELESIVIPYFVVQMGENVFVNCSRLKTIFCERKSASNNWDPAWSEGCNADIDDGSGINEHSSNRMNISMIDGMNGHDFEHFCANLLIKNGFLDARVTKGSGDQGVDILAVKDNIKYAIQCKNYASPLSNTPVQEVNAGKIYYKCHVGVVMTNSTFTQGAKTLAEATGVLLWDRSVLTQMMENAN